jgi:uncharacterized membrane protein
MWTARTKIGWGLLLAGAVLLGLFAARYYTLDPQVYFQPDVYQAKIVGLMVHITGMIVAVLVGPFQFHRRLRERRPRLHRMLGKVYIVSAIIGALGGLYMSPFSASGAVTHVSFALMGLGTLLATTVALWRIRSGDVQGHREWMTRSYALIFGGVTLRLYAGPLEAVFGEHDGYAITAWACWVPNLVFAQWLIRSRLRPHPEAPKGIRMGVRQAT